MAEQAGAGAGSGIPTDRVETLADTVFAIVMTLLVLEFIIPADLRAADLGTFLGDLQPTLRSYVVTFVALGVYWVGHHLQFRFIQRADRPLLWINILFLMVISLLPFTTALLGRYPDEQLPVLLYGSHLVAIGLVNELHWVYATRGHRLTSATLDPRVIQLAERRILFAPAMALLAMGLSFLSLLAAQVVFLLLFVPYSLPSRIERHFAHAERHGGKV